MVHSCTIAIKGGRLGRLRLVEAGGEAWAPRFRAGEAFLGRRGEGVRLRRLRARRKATFVTGHVFLTKRRSLRKVTLFLTRSLSLSHSTQMRMKTYL